MNMKVTTIACFLVTLAVAAGCNPEPSGFPLSIGTVQKIESGSLNYEEREGKIMVSVVDRFGDCHIHVLNHDGMTKAQALSILKTKQEDLKKRNPNQASDATSEPAPGAASSSPQG
jgi:hypothetical protein